MQPFLLVGLGGALGAMARYGTSVAVAQVWRSSFPVATIIVNVAGCLAMGVLIGWLARTVPAWQIEARLFLAVGILGGFTTFSAFSLDVVSLIERGETLPALGYVLASVLLSILALFVGLLLVRALPA